MQRICLRIARDVFKLLECIKGAFLLQVMHCHADGDRDRNKRRKYAYGVVAEVATATLSYTFKNKRWAEQKCTPRGIQSIYQS